MIHGDGGDDDAGATGHKVVLNFGTVGDAGVVEHGHGVVGHLFEGVHTVRLVAAAGAAIVQRDRLKPRGFRRDDSTRARLANRPYPWISRPLSAPG